MVTVDVGVEDVDEIKRRVMKRRRKLQMKAADQVVDVDVEEEETTTMMMMMIVDSRIKMEEMKTYQPKTVRDRDFSWVLTVVVYSFDVNLNSVFGSF